MKIKTLAAIFFILSCLLLAPHLLNAQPNFNRPVSDAPIDGGLSLLIATGIGYGLKQVKENKKSSLK